MQEGAFAQESIELGTQLVCVRADEEPAGKGQLGQPGGDVAQGSWPEAEDVVNA